MQRQEPRYTIKFTDGDFIDFATSETVEDILFARDPRTIEEIYDTRRPSRVLYRKNQGWFSTRLVPGEQDWPELMRRF